MGQFIRDVVQKIGFVKLVLIGIAGAVIVILSVSPGKDISVSGEDTKAETKQETAKELMELEEKLEIRLEEFLSQVEGVGKVDVIISLKSGEGEEILKDSTSSRNEVTESDSQGGSRQSLSISQSEETITKEGSDTDTGETPYVLKKLAPEIAGIAIAAEGGGDVLVVQKLTEMMAALFAIDVTQVSVVKMK